MGLIIPHVRYADTTDNHGQGRYIIPLNTELSVICVVYWPPEVILTPPSLMVGTKNVNIQSLDRNHLPVKEEAQRNNEKR